jgi:TP901 family phage tail tape measure protein
MNIQVRVLSTQAQARIRALEAELAALQRQANLAGASMGRMGASGIPLLARWGSQVQWLGRSLQYNFTLPILLATGAAVKFALDNEKAMTRVTKVYGDGTKVFNKLAKTEIPALERSFEALSNTFGTARKDVINIAGDWAAAGASGVALAKSVKLTLETMILGEMDATEATQALIAIQAQYGYSTQQLAKTIDVLNMTENQTGISLQGLVQGFARAAGVARSAGVDVEHLSAMLAALTPAAGSAAQAGNGLKTMISRLLAPTKEAAEVLGLMHINTKDVAWNSLNASQRLELMAQKFKGLDDAVKATVSSVIASRYQINRFDVLMRDIINTNGYYQKSLRATQDEQRNFAQRVKELNVVLESNPQKLKQVWVILQNAMADVVVPMIPYIVYLGQRIAELMNSFANLDPAVQKLTIAGLLFLAVLGPIARYVGAVAILAGILHRALIRIIPVIARMLLFFVSWPVIFAAVVVAVIFFRDQIKEAWNKLVQYVYTSQSGIAQALRGIVDLFYTAVKWIQDAFYALPQSIQNAMIQIVRTIAAAAKAVYDWFSYINPFAHHSPSLVESVTNGVAVIQAEFAKLTSTGSIFKQVAADLQRFKAIASKMGTAPWHDERVDVAKAYKSALPIFDKLVGDWRQLNDLLDRQKAKVDAQQAVVDKWANKLDRANKILDTEQSKLNGLQDKLQKLTDKYEAHQQALEAYANAPLKGMGAMEDAIFENEMAQKKLRLEMLRWEKVNGNLDDTKNKIASLMGTIELLRGQVADLRSAGAGSEITGPIKDQIAQLEAQAGVMTQAVNNSPMAKMQQELDALAQRAEELDLEKSLQFDPLTRQIEKMVNTTKELTFDEIVNGIKNEQAAMERLQPKIDEYTAAVAAQQAVVDAATASRDKIQAQYDVEQAKLDKLQAAYDKTADAIRSVEDALQQMGQIATEQLSKLEDAANKAKSAASSVKELSPGAQNFIDAQGGNFPDVGGMAKIGREGSLKDQSKLIDEFTQGLTDELGKTFGKIDMFAPLKNLWRGVVDWLKSHVHVDLDPLRGEIADVWAALGDIKNPFSGNSKFAKGFQTFGSTVMDIFTTLWTWIKHIFGLFWPDIKEIFSKIVTAGKEIWSSIGPELKKFGDLWPGFAKAIQNVWNILKPLVALVGGAFLLALKIVSTVLANVIGPVLDFVVASFQNFLQIIRGVVEIFIGIFTLDFPMAMQGLKDVFLGIFDQIWEILKGVGKVLWGIVSGIVEGIYNFFVWLADVLVGHSVIPDMVDAIVAVFKLLVVVPKWIWDHVLKPVFDFFKSVWDDYIGPELKKWWGYLQNVWNGLKSAGQWVWSNVLKPVWDWFHDLWTDYVGPALSAWWEGIKTAWDLLKGAGQWVWNNALKPVWDFFHDLWTEHVGPALSDWWNRIKNAWDDIKKAGEWVKTNVMDPVKNAFVDGWNAIKDWFTNNSDKILAPIKSVVKLVVGAINWIIKGINQLDNLPGVKINIAELTLPEGFRSGGALPTRKVMAGFVTNGARAIVGEGRQAYPEYVIPTDPRYRDRAQRLTAQAAAKLNMSAVPMHGIGGLLGDFGDVIGDLGGFAWDKVKAAGQFAWNTTTDPFFALANAAANKIDWSVARDAARGGIGVARDWVQAGQEAWAQAYKDAKPAPGKPFPVQPGDWSPVSFQGVTLDRGQMRALIAAGAAYGGPFHISQGSYRPYTSYSGATHMGGGAADITSPVNTRFLDDLLHNGQAAWIRDPSQGPWPWHIHTLQIGDPNLSSAARAQVQDFLAGGDGLAAGGIVRARIGGVMRRLGEGGRDEAVIPLPHDWSIPANSSGSRDGNVYNFYGDLEFPNITSGDDAETFVTNLANLTKD